LKEVLANVEKAIELSENTSHVNIYLNDIKEEFSSIFEENDNNDKQALDAVKKYIEEEIESKEAMESLKNLSLSEQSERNKESESADSDSDSSSGAGPTSIGPSNTENSSDSETSSSSNRKTSLKGYILSCMGTLGD
jgi:hypothetical protein